jgi:hypothetical protein
MRAPRPVNRRSPAFSLPFLPHPHTPPPHLEPVSLSLPAGRRRGCGSCLSPRWPSVIRIPTFGCSSRLSSGICTHYLFQTTCPSSPFGRLRSSQETVTLPVVSFVSSAHSLFRSFVGSHISAFNCCKSQSRERVSQSTISLKGYGRFRAYPCVDERVLTACTLAGAFGFGCGSR